MGKNKSSMKNTVFIVCFIAMAVILLLICIFMFGMTDKGDESTISDDTSYPVVTEDTLPVTSEAEITETDTEEITEVTEEKTKSLAFSDSNSELRDINAVLDKEKNKTYRVNLSEIADEWDVITSFTFYFSSADGISNMGLTKIGSGVSVSEDCPYATDELWYQPDDFSIENQGTQSMVKWDIPEDVRLYINIADGKLMFGYWWSDIDSVKLDRIVCEKMSILNVSCDGEKNIECKKQLSYSETSNVISVPVRDLISENETIQSIDFSFTGSGGDSKCDCSAYFSVNTAEGVYTSRIAGVQESGNVFNLAWIIPEDVLKNIDYNSDFEINIMESSVSELTLDKIHVQWSEKK